MPFSIPVVDNPDQTQRVQIGNTVYNFRIRWSVDTECWYIYIGGVGSDPVFKNKMRVGVDLLRGFKSYDNVPPGSLFVFDIEQLFGRVDRDNLGIGRRFQLIYFDVDETIPVPT